MNNPYAILNIPQTATVDDAKKAYKKLANKHHPDKGGNVEKFKEVKQAFETIKQQKNKQYNFKTSDEIYNFYRQAQYREQKQAIKITADISIRDAILGGEHTMFISPNQNITINLPKNIYEGEVIKFPQAKIDLFVKFTIRKNKEYELKGADIYKTEEVSIWDLINGITREILLLDNKKIKITIPALTAPGTKMKLANKGLQNRNNYLQKGDMYIVIKAVIPNKISNDLMDLIKKETVTH